MDSTTLQFRLEQALLARTELLNDRWDSALRLFSGFYEGCPDLVVDLYARTLLVHNYAELPESAGWLVETAVTFYREKLPGLRTGVLKLRASTNPSERNGVLLFGESPDRRIREEGVAYALDLTMNRDASFYLDTRGLRTWLREHLVDQSVLNAFAYTGSLGVAAVAGGARRVVQTDLNRKFLNLAKDSCTINGFTIHRGDYIGGDFWQVVSQLKRAGEFFDAVILDPPFFAATNAGKVDLNQRPERVINKVRPLVRDGGWLITINNAVFVSGAEYIATLDELCADGYLALETIIQVPTDVTGFPQTICSTPPVDPSPFNHPTKIAVLRVRRKNSSKSNDPIR